MKQAHEAVLGRRELIKGAAIGAAVAALPAVLAGCAQGQGGAAQEAGEATAPATLVSPMSEEERIASIADPKYMGAQVNFAGQDVVVGTGPKGQVVNQISLDAADAENVGALEKVTDNCYVSHVYALSNVTMVRGKTGLVIIDTTGMSDVAAMCLEAFREQIDLPVSALIYSHSHYVDGATAFVPEGNPDNIPVIANELLPNELSARTGVLAPTYTLRSIYQFSKLIPGEGEDANVQYGGSSDASGTHTKGFVTPNVWIPSDQTMTEMEVDGLTVQFFPGFADDQCSLSVYFKDYDLLFSNHVMPCFFNMYTLRGEPYRDPARTCRELDTVIALNASEFVPNAGPAIHGREDIARELTLYRDAIQFIYDQTRRYINHNLGPDEIIEKVKIPVELISGELTNATYGECEHYIRGVYRGVIGWWATEMIDLHPVSKNFEAAKLVEALGGAGAVLEQAQAAFDDNQWAWAATLATYVLRTDPENEDAKAAKANALRKMGQVTESSITRSEYLTEARILEGTATLPLPTDGSVSFGKLEHSTMDPVERRMVLDVIGTHLDPEAIRGIDATFTLTYTDEGVSNTMHVRNFVGAVSEGRPESPDVELKIGYYTIIDVLSQAKTIDECVQSGEATVEGDADLLNTILGACDVKFV